MCNTNTGRVDWGVLIFYLEDEWFEEILNKLSITKYSINDSENYHTLYFDSDEEANTKFKEIISFLKSIGFRIVRDCY